MRAAAIPELVAQTWYKYQLTTDTFQYQVFPFSTNPTKNPTRDRARAPASAPAPAHHSRAAPSPTNIRPSAPGIGKCVQCAHDDGATLYTSIHGLSKSGSSSRFRNPGKPWLYSISSTLVSSIPFLSPFFHLYSMC